MKVKESGYNKRSNETKNEREANLVKQEEPRNRNVRMKRTNRRNKRKHGNIIASERETQR